MKRRLEEAHVTAVVASALELSCPLGQFCPHAASSLLNLTTTP